MKSIIYIAVLLLVHIFSPVSHAADTSISEKSIIDAFGNISGGCVFMDCLSDEIIRYNPNEMKMPITPCSTFKIWNTLIGLESNLISSPDEPFYTWDKEKRAISDWNRNLSLKEAFSVSCVPAFQNLARKIGPEIMQKWMNTIQYGNCDISSGVDDFWLPRDNKKAIKISPEEQAMLIRKLITGQLPFSKKSQKILKEVMVVTKTSKGTFYGKTGSGRDLDGNPARNVGWFVGYVESGRKIISFSCVVKGNKLSGKDSKRIVETILKKNDLL